jgi:hypothetical protein
METKKTNIVEVETTEKTTNPTPVKVEEKKELTAEEQKQVALKNLLFRTFADTCIGYTADEVKKLALKAYVLGIRPEEIITGRYYGIKLNGVPQVFTKYTTTMEYFQSEHPKAVVSVKFDFDEDKEPVRAVASITENGLIYEMETYAVEIAKPFKNGNLDLGRYIFNLRKASVKNVLRYNFSQYLKAYDEQDLEQIRADEKTNKAVVSKVEQIKETVKGDVL